MSCRIGGLEARKLWHEPREVNASGTIIASLFSHGFSARVDDDNYEGNSGRIRSSSSGKVVPRGGDHRI